MAVPDRTRAGHMQGRLRRELRDRGVDGTDLADLTTLHQVAMAPRHEGFDDDHHPVYLHPARSALIVMLEGCSTDPRALALALLVDSEPEADRGLVPSDTEAVLRACGAPWADEVRTVAAELPPLEAEDRPEWLVTAPSWVRIAVLSERLDHLRHLHLWRGPRVLRRARGQVRRVDLPIARRTGDRLARLLEGWLERVERHRLEERARPRPTAD